MATPSSAPSSATTNQCQPYSTRLKTVVSVCERRVCVIDSRLACLRYYVILASTPVKHTAPENRSGQVVVFFGPDAQDIQAKADHSRRGSGGCCLRASLVSLRSAYLRRFSV
ncbi:hypothetical protein ZHAS_00013432 [Anopheles sinensis]|uniref:Uncharacterized protein n=1 Tax=Anopheles sinensis TaxID=74873 RepID=A0A084W5K1_ANOSI|nr:hypothetical protein ZHAS_00013432 [Anopheles sinensis]